MPAREKKAREAFFASWRCNCTIVQKSKSAIWRVCPNHGRELLGPIQLVFIDKSIKFGLEPAP